MKTEKVEIEIKKLQEVADYYEFPLAVFFTPLGSLKGKNRHEEIFKRAEAFEKIKEIVEEVE